MKERSVAQAPKKKEETGNGGQAGEGGGMPEMPQPDELPKVGGIAPSWGMNFPVGSSGGQRLTE